MTTDPGADHYQPMSDVTVGKLWQYPVKSMQGLEVDQIDRRTRTGWSVLVRGLAEELTDAHGAELIRRTQATGVRPWAPGEHGRWLRIIPQGMTGRRIVAGELPPPFEDGSYL